MGGEARGVLEEQGLLAFGVLDRTHAQGVAEAEARLARRTLVDCQSGEGGRKGALLVEAGAFEGLADIQGWGFWSLWAGELGTTFEGLG